MFYNSLSMFMFEYSVHLSLKWSVIIFNQEGRQHTRKKQHNTQTYKDQICIPFFHLFPISVLAQLTFNLGSKGGRLRFPGLQMCLQLLLRRKGATKDQGHHGQLQLLRQRSGFIPTQPGVAPARTKDLRCRMLFL